MKTFLNPEDKNFFCGATQDKHAETGGAKSNDSSYRENQSESEHKKTWWSRCKFKMKSLWEKARPVIDGIITVLTVVTSLMKAATKFFKQYQSMKEAMA